MKRHHWGKRLVASGLVAADGIRGDSVEEISCVLAERPEVRPPEEFIGYLRGLGKTAISYIDTNISCFTCREGVRVARDLARTDPDFSLSGKFFIAQHDGYILWYFKDFAPEVCRWIEGDGESRLADSFEEFMEYRFQSALANREEARRFERFLKERKSRRRQ